MDDNNTLIRLVAADELEEATEASIVSYALRGLPARFAEISRTAETRRT
jgi:hypothetical protein